MHREEIDQKFKGFKKQLPTKQMDGKTVIDYHGSSEKMAILIFTFFEDKILLVHRSSQVSTYPNKWHVVSGYYDSEVTPEDLALEELHDELGILDSNVRKMEVGRMFKESSWYLVPVYVELNSITTEFTLNWENTEAGFFTEGQIEELDLVSEVRPYIKKIFELRTESIEGESLI